MPLSWRCGSDELHPWFRGVTSHPFRYSIGCLWRWRWCYRVLSQLNRKWGPEISGTTVSMGYLNPQKKEKKLSMRNFFNFISYLSLYQKWPSDFDTCEPHRQTNKRRKIRVFPICWRLYNRIILSLCWSHGSRTVNTTTLSYQTTISFSEILVESSVPVKDLCTVVCRKNRRKLLKFGYIHAVLWGASC